MRSIGKKISYLAILALLVVVAYAFSNTTEVANAGDKIWEDSGSNHEPYLNPEINKNMTNLVQNTLPAVVSIATENVVKMRRRGRGMNPNEPFGDFFDFFFNQPFGNKFKQQGMGSGFIINPQGYILTNNHVVERADAITVQLDGGAEYPAKVIGKDSKTDMALIKIEPDKPLPYLVLGDSDKLEIGHMVIAMGNPFGLSQTVTSGIVSQKGRKDINPSGRRIYANFIQTDASINPGNSGGPLLNIFGEVVGINTAIAQGQGIGFAIPINMTKTLLPQLMKGKIKRSWIGIQVQEITKELADSLGLKITSGALIASVVEDSPAEKAGLKPEDVILGFDGKEIKSYSDLTWYASTAGAGKKVSLKIWRAGKIRFVDLTLGVMPGETNLADSGESKDKGYEAFGAKIVTPSQSQLKDVGITDGRGALVAEIEQTAPAFRAGLRAGDIIRKVNTRMVKDASHCSKLSKSIKKGRIVRLFVNRNTSALFIAFRI